MIELRSSSSTPGVCAPVVTGAGSADADDLAQLRGGIVPLRIAPTDAEAKWLRVSDACRIYSLSRVRIYELIASGEIRSCSLKKKHHIRGARRLLRSSLDDYFERHATGGTSI